MHMAAGKRGIPEGFGWFWEAINGAGAELEKSLISRSVKTQLVVHLKSCRSFGFVLAAVVDAGGRDVGVTAAFLDFGDVGVVIESTGAEGGAPCHMEVVTEGSGASAATQDDWNLASAIDNLKLAPGPMARSTTAR
jgi:hypothetical protein